MEKLFKLLVIPVVMVPLAYLALIWSHLPDQVPVHFGIDGRPDRIGDKNELLISVFVLTVISFLTWLALVNIHRLDPKKYAAENRKRMQRLGFGLTVFMSALSCMIIYSASSANSGQSVSWILSLVGLLFAFIGNYMPNIKPNYFAGFRLPWTLESEDNWRKTHALVGKLWFPGGMLIAVACIFLPPTIAFIFFITVMIIITLIPVVFSYRYYLQQKRKPN